MTTKIVSSANTALNQIDCDETVGRYYIPLPNNWEVQTKGRGSSFRIAKTDGSHVRHLVTDERLHPVIEDIARSCHQFITSQHEAMLSAAPVIQSAEGDGVSVALKYLRNKVNDFDSEYARQDYETGAWEFGSTAQEEYSNSMHELIEELEGLEPKVILPQLPPDAAARIADLEAKAAKYDAINTPEIQDFLTAVHNEALHQRERWGSEHDAGKTDADWFWLVGFLTGKAIRPDNTPEKSLHHIITTAAALLNWHAAKIGVHNLMRPGIGPDAQPPKPQSPDALIAEMEGKA